MRVGGVMVEVKARLAANNDFSIRGAEIDTKQCDNLTSLTIASRRVVADIGDTTRNGIQRRSRIRHQGETIGEYCTAGDNHHGRKTHAGSQYARHLRVEG